MGITTNTHEGLKSITGDLNITTLESNADVLIKGNDGGASITALTLDMSDSGTAYFNDKLYIPSYIAHTGDPDTVFGFSGNDTFIIHTAGTTAVTINGSQNATFAGQVSAAGSGVSAFTTVSGKGYSIASSRIVYYDGTTYLGNIDNQGSGSTVIRSAGNNALVLDTSSNATFAGNIVMAANATVDGVDISGLPTSFAPTNADVTPSWVPSSNPNYLTSSSTQTKYLRSDTSDTTTGSLTIEGGIQIEGSLSRGTYASASQYHTGADNIVLKGNATGISGIYFESEKNGTNINHPSDFGFIQYHPYGTVNSSGEASELIIGVSNDGDDNVIVNAPNVSGFKFRTAASETDYTVYHSGNLTPLVVGATSSTAKAGNTPTISASQAQAITDNTAKTSNVTHTGEVTGSGSLTIAGNVVDEANLKVSNSPTNGYYLTAQSGNTGGLTWAAIPTLNQNTTGDAGTVDGLNAAQFVRSDAADTASGRISFLGNDTNNQDTIATSTGSLGGIEIYNNGSAKDAFMAFHAGGDFACYFGLDAGTNKLSVGGWSMGAASYEIYHAGNKPSLSTLGYTGATNANYITNNNQLTNGSGYLTSTNDRVYITDSRGSARAPSYYNDRYAQWDFQSSTDTGAGGDGWHAIQTISKWTVYDASHRQEQLIFTGNDLKRRTASSDTAWGTTKTIYDSGNLTVGDGKLSEINFTSADHTKLNGIAPNATADQTNVSGSSGSCTGNAATATTAGKLTENNTIVFGASNVQWTDQSGNGGTGMNGQAPRNPANNWYHSLIFNHANSSGYYSQIVRLD